MININSNVCLKILLYNKRCKHGNNNCCCYETNAVILFSVNKLTLFLTKS